MRAVTVTYAALFRTICATMDVYIIDPAWRQVGSAGGRRGAIGTGARQRDVPRRGAFPEPASFHRRGGPSGTGRSAEGLHPGFGGVGARRAVRSAHRSHCPGRGIAASVPARCGLRDRRPLGYRAHLIAKGRLCIPVFDMRPAATPMQPGASRSPLSHGSTVRLPGNGIQAEPFGMAVSVAVPTVIAGWLFTRPVPRAPAAPEMRLEITTPPTTDSVSLAISPDGRSLVFVGSADGLSRLWIRGLDSMTPRQLVGTEHASLPFWAPDGRSIGFFADGKIKRIDIESGLVQPISTAAVPAGAAWNSDGVILHPLVPDSPLFRTSVSGSPLVPATQLAPGQTGHRGRAFLPDGRHFLFYAMGSTTVRGIYVGELGTMVIRRLLDADTPAVFAPPSHVLYLQHSTLFAHRLDPQRSRSSVNRWRSPKASRPNRARACRPVAASSTGTIVYRTGSRRPAAVHLGRSSRQGDLAHDTRNAWSIVRLDLS